MTWTTPTHSEEKYIITNKWLFHWRHVSTEIVVAIKFLFIYSAAGVSFHLRFTICGNHILSLGETHWSTLKELFYHFYKKNICQLWSWNPHITICRCSFLKENKCSFSPCETCNPFTTGCCSWVPVLLAAEPSIWGCCASRTPATAAERKQMFLSHFSCLMQFPFFFKCKELSRS